MSPVNAFITKHPALTYFALTCAISWGLVVVVVGRAGFRGTAEPAQSLLPYAILAMIAGPSIAGFALTGALGGTPALREFRRRLVKWDVRGRWYAAALLIAPTVMLAVLLPLSLISRAFVPGIYTHDDSTGLVLSGLAIALAAGVFEELGWTGFAVPTLRRRHGVFATGLAVGMLWAAWHWLVAVWAIGPSPDTLSLASYLLDPILFLVGFRVLMTWVYDQTESILVAMMMHASLTGSALILGAPGLRGTPLLIFDVVWFAAIWLVVAALVRDGLTDNRDAAEFPQPGTAADATYVSELHWRVLASSIGVVAVAIAIWLGRGTLVNLYAVRFSQTGPEGWQSVASNVVDAIVGTAAVIGFLRLVSAVGAIVSTRVKVTSQHVTVTSGVLRQHTFEMPLDQVEAVSVNQSPIGRWLDYGTVTVAGTGGTREAIRFLVAPHEFRRRIVDDSGADLAAIVRRSA
jgi:membrane protease YdiL (CAAX protease family)